MLHTTAPLAEHLRGLGKRLRAWYQRSPVRRTTIATQVLIGIVLLSVCATAYVLVAEQIRKSADERLAAAASLNALRIQSEIDRFLVEFERLQRQVSLAGGLADSATGDATRRKFLAALREQRPELTSLALVDRRGNVLAVADAHASGVDAGIAGRILGGAGPFLSLQPAPKEMRLALAYPIFHEAGGQAVGALLGVVDLPVLLQRTGILAATAGDLSLSVVLEDAAGKSLYAAGSAGDQPHLSARAPLASLLAERGVPLQVAVSVSRAQAYAPLSGVATLLAILAVLAVGAIVLMTRRLSSVIVGPLAEMSQRAMEIAGAGPSGLRELPVNRSDEIGWMGMAFNEMVYSLREAYDNQEAEVRGRTAELALAKSRLVGVLAGIDDVVYAVDPAFRNWDYLSPAAEKVFGYAAERCLAEPAILGNIALREDADRLAEARRTLAPGQPTEIRYRIRREDGQVRWVLDRFHLVPNERGDGFQVNGLVRDVTAAVEAEASLHLHERALASASCGIVISDMQQPGQPIIYANEAFERMTGYTAAEVLGRNCALLQGEARERQSALDEIRLAIAEGRECRVIIRNYRKDGEAFWNELQLSPLHDMTGRVSHYIGIQNDISANIAATHALVSSEQRLALVIDALHEGVWDWNIPNRTLQTSPAWAGILGLDPVEVAGQQDLDAFYRQVPEDWSERVRAEVQSRLEGRADEFYLEHPMLHADGHRIWVANHARVVERDASGQALRMVGTIVDISQRVESSQQIIGLMSQLDTIFTLSPDAFIYFNGQGLTSFVNPAFERLTGIRAGEMTGRTAVEVRQRLREQCDPTHAFPSFDDSLVDASQDGQLMFLLRPLRRVLQVSRRRSDSGSVIYMRDVTRETEVDRMKSEFLTTAAHELRTPMASIMGFSELLMLRDFSPERTRDMLSTMHRQARRLTDLVNELLDLARIESRGGKDFNIARHRIEPVVRDAVAAFHVDGDRARMQLHLPDELPELEIDPAKMQQAVINLLSNAYKYSPQGGPIDITVRRRETAAGSQVGIVVTDRGIGMAPEQLARVCERFFRADPSGNIPGTGLGMSLVKEIMDTHGGSVELDSELGVGTAVSLWLPISRPVASVEPAPAPPAATPSDLTLWLHDAPPGSEKSLH